jgi:L-amino acid N-acyltransferase YncA
MTAEIRLLQPSDLSALTEFVNNIPEGDRTFFREDVLDPDVVGRWQTHGGERWLSVDDQVVTGYLGIVPDVGWSSHVGELRLVVDASRRREGIGRSLARHGLLRALELGLSKIVVHVVAAQESTLAMFSVLGFDAEALLRDQVRDGQGQLHDLLMMSHFVNETFDVMRSTGIAEAITT